MNAIYMQMVELAIQRLYNISSNAIKRIRVLKEKAWKRIEIPLEMTIRQLIHKTYVGDALIYYRRST